jgi:amino acid transporter
MEKAMYKQKRVKNSVSQRKVLAKAVSFKDYVGLGIGAIIGIGWVIVAGEWLTKGGPLGAILGFILGGLLLIAVGKCYAELTPAIPVAGGEVAFSYKAFGNATSFLTGWLLSFGLITICPFETVAIGWLFEYIFPEAKSQALYTIGGYDVSLSSIVPGLLIGLFIIVLNYLGIKNTARFQTISTGFMFLCVIVFTVTAFIKGSFSNMLPPFAGSGTMWSSLKSIIAVLGIVPWFMAGFDDIPQAAEESGKKVNPKDIGKAVIISIIVGFMFYVIVIVALSLCLPWHETTKFEMPTADVFRVAFGYEWITNMVLFAAFLGLITSLNATFLAGSRVLFASGRGALLPKWFGEINEKYRTPKNAIIFVGIITLIGPFVGKASLLPIVAVGSLAYVSAWFITCLASIKLRKSAPNMKRPYKVKNKITLYLGAVISGVLVLLIILPGSSAQLKWPIEYIILGTWILLGYIGYRWRQSSKDMSKDERDYQILGDYR